MTTDLTTLNSVSRSKVETPQLPTIAQNSASATQATDSAAPALQAENVIRLNAVTRQKAAAKTEMQADQQQPSEANKQQNDQALSESILTLNQAAQVVSRNLEFRVDENSGRTVITVKDSQTDEIIRQIPSDQLLKIAARLQELQESRQEDRSASGILFTSQT